MACTIELSKEQRTWFEARPVAWAIVNDGRDDLAPKNSPHGNLVALLANMADYGRAHWKYEPGSTTHVDNTLKGLHDVTDCGSLAHIFEEIAEHLGYTNAKAWHILPPGDNRDRIVTSENLQCFTGQVGDPTIEGRWCFGDHWIVICDSKSYDPTFNQYFDSAPLPPYFGWWGHYVHDRTVFATHYFSCKDRPSIYNGYKAGTAGRPFRPAIQARRGFFGIGRRAYVPAQPAVAPTPGKMFYTYKRTDATGQEIDE